MARPKKDIFENAFCEVKGFIKTKDKRTKNAKFETSLAKQEFLTEVKEIAEKWFDERVKGSSSDK